MAQVLHSWTAQLWVPAPLQPQALGTHVQLHHLWDLSSCRQKCQRILASILTAWESPCLITES